MIIIIKKLFRKSKSLNITKNRFGDKIFAYISFLRCHKRLPKNNSFNDLLFRIKTSDEILSVLRQYTSDKEYVKNYISKTVGDEYNVKTKAILRSKSDVEHYNFVSGDVVKPTHASGYIKFVKTNSLNKSDFIDWLKLDYYDISREANYRYLKPKIIVEEQIFGRMDVDDIKFHCYQGRVKIIQWDFDRHTNHTRMLYDRNWNSLDASLGYPKSIKKKSRPHNLNEMIIVAEKLAKPFNFVRIDLFHDDKSNEFLVGEITHCHGSSNESFDCKKSEEKVSKILQN